MKALHSWPLTNGQPEK